ncbi:hypothetical protein SPSYN_01277 [Sporotomaculum syntrophicum]|uniref:Uncharacterized protein n=1 Tax=Sporotomaculum syntrophicum TaxID=182264 RepID=A0A9D2WQM7_9FIRM|nr:hypothetical protein SPSYN_01277 [Sporotomaculum syntrophicum]
MVLAFVNISKAPGIVLIILRGCYWITVSYLGEIGYFRKNGDTKKTHHQAMVCFLVLGEAGWLLTNLTINNLTIMEYIVI